MIRSECVIPEDLEEERLDKAMPVLIGEHSRTFFQKLIRDGQVQVNGKEITKPGFVLHGEDRVSFVLPEPVTPEIEPENIPLDILYEDDDLLIVNKPKGMVVHPAAGHAKGTLVGALMYHCKGQLSGINGVLRPGIVHRIDKDTTGSLVVCKNDFTHNAIAEQLKDHSIERIYLAICHGHLPASEGTVETQIGRDPKDRKKMAVVSSGGKRAVTHYRVLKTFRDTSYVACILETGRTHQIRVHMAYLGHPLLGDDVYSHQKSPYHLQGQCLHAMRLGFIHPRTGERICVDAPLPDYFQHLLEIMP